jgi:DNA-binding NtrC family response regulator
MTEKSRLHGKKILIVDDEPDVLETLEELLNMCELHRASSFDEAKELMTSGTLDMVILDIMGVNGYALLDMAVKKNLLAVMLTAHALSIEDTVKSYKKGAAFFVPKERMTEIESVLDDVLAAREEGGNHWYNWLERMGDYYEKRFGPNWKDSQRDFWEALDKHDWRLASRLRERE